MTEYACFCLGVNFFHSAIDALKALASAGGNVHFFIFVPIENSG